MKVEPQPRVFVAPDKPGVYELDPQQAGAGNRIEMALPHEEVTMRFTAIDQDIYVPLPKAKKMPRTRLRQEVQIQPKKLEALEDDYDSYAEAIDELLKIERQKFDDEQSGDKQVDVNDHGSGREQDDGDHGFGKEQYDGDPSFEKKQDDSDHGSDQKQNDDDHSFEKKQDGSDPGSEKNQDNGDPGFEKTKGDQGKQVPRTPPVRLVTSRILGRGRNRQVPLEFSEVQAEPCPEPNASDDESPSLTADEVWKLLQDSDDEYYFEEKICDDSVEADHNPKIRDDSVEADHNPSLDDSLKVDHNQSRDDSLVEHHQSDATVDKKEKKKKNKKDNKAGKDKKKKSVSQDEDDIPLSEMVKRRRTRTSPWTRRNGRF